ncbi:MAG: hypothetical protein L0Z49_02360 [Actinobacteria bacterium]|nr:hypothetical protein [Actinomycetota bacterium]
MESMTLPGFEAETGAAPGDTGQLGLSGRWSTTTAAGHTALLKNTALWLGVAAVVVVGLIALVSLWPEQAPRVAVDQTIPPSAQEDIAAVVAPGSLAVELGQVAERWNEVDLTPKIVKGFILHPEVGQFDSFTYRFNESSLLAGAYDPENDYVYAFMASSWLSDEAAPHLSLHLCHLTQPYSQECIDTFITVGLAGQTLESFVDLETPYETEWKMGEHTWRLEIADNIQTIRVLGPGAG